MLVPDLRMLAHATHPPDARALGQLRELACFLREGEASDLASGLEAAVHLVEACTAVSDRIDRRSIANTARRLLELLDEPVREHAARRADAGEAEAPPENGTPSSAAARPKSLRLDAGEPGSTLEPEPVGPPEPEPSEPQGSSPDSFEVLGEILVRLGQVGEEQVAAALELQRERGLPIGDCLLILGAVSPDQLFAALRLQRKLAGEGERDAASVPRPVARVQIPKAREERGSTPPPAAGVRPVTMRENAYFGEVLLGTGWITQEQLREAMQRHNLDGTPLGETLLGLGYLSREDLHQALELQRSLQGIARIRPGRRR